jgi:transporter family protein
MESIVIGFLFLGGYVVLVGAATFLQKFTMSSLTPYQINFLMALGMLVIAVPALWLKQGNLSVPVKSLRLGAPIGLMMALGSFCFVLALPHLSVGTASALSTSYVVLVAILSWMFLGEQLTITKLIGIALTVSGAGLLTFGER